MFKLLTLLISLIPLQKIKIILYNFMGIKICKKSKIGFFVIIYGRDISIKCSTLESLNFVSANNILLTDTIIKSGNFINNINKLEISSSTIGNLNKFVAGKKKYKEKNNLIIKSSEIFNNNLFDLTSSIYLEKVKIQSFNQFWTHGFDVYRKIKLGDIEVKNNIIINNKVIVLPGIKLANDITIQSGTVVHKSILEKGEYYSSLICKF